MSFETEVNSNEANECQGNSCTTMLYHGNFRPKISDEEAVIEHSKSEELGEFSGQMAPIGENSNQLQSSNPANNPNMQFFPHKVPVQANQQLPALSSVTRKFNCGLKNLGNTCYINSCLQALYITNKIRRHLLKKYNSGPLHNALSKLFYQMDKIAAKCINNQECLVIKPEEFINEFRSLKPQFVKHEQHDAQEFLSILLECIHQEANQAKKDNTKNVQVQLNNAEEAWNHHVANVDSSYYSRLFVGQLESGLKCLTCNNVSLSWSCFWQIPLHLTDTSTNINDSKENLQETVLTIEECIKEYTAPEILSDDCSPFCDKCHQRRASVKQQTICRVPHYLIIHLKRFTHTGTKITRKVVINPTLNLCQKTFVLYSCVLHRGTETMGHYFTLFNVSNNEWMIFDDESIMRDISNEQAENLLQEYAYICFYKAISKTAKVVIAESNEHKQ